MKKLVKLRTRAFFSQQCRCIYCKLPIWEQPFRERLAEALQLPEEMLKYLQSTAEHLVAQQDGGRDSPSNIAAACAWCNRKRHAHRNVHAPEPDAFMVEVRRGMAKKLWHPAARWVERRF